MSRCWSGDSNGDGSAAPTSTVDWSFGQGRPRQPQTIRTLPPEPGERLILEPDEKEEEDAPFTAVTTKKCKGAKQKVVSQGYEYTPSSIHGSIAKANVRVQNGKLVNNFEPSLEEISALTVNQSGNKFNKRLVEEFEKGIKQPVSALTEWGMQFKRRVEFKEVAVERENQRLGCFAFVAFTDGVKHPQGVDRTKKEAKAKAASIAFCIIHKLPLKIGDTPRKPPPLPASFPAFPGTENEEFTQQKQAFYQLVGDTESSFVSQSTYRPPVARAFEGSVPEAPPGFEAEENEVDVVFDIFQLKIDQILSTLQGNPDLPRLSSNFAGFLVQKGPDSRSSVVVAMGCGSDHLTSEPDLNSQGYLIHDSHALVLAKRSFQRYLYTQAKKIMDPHGFASVDSIFSPNSTSGKLRLNTDVQIHLCMTVSPCGEALNAGKILDNDSRLSRKELDAIAGGEHYPGQMHNSGKVHLKQRGLQTVFSTEQVASETTFEVASCSDKLYKWNVLGVQGTLLSWFFEPLYLTSVNIGAKYNHAGLVRSICCRGNSSSVYGQLLAPYHLEHPFVGRTTNSQCQRIDLSRELAPLLALNWECDDGQIEILDPSCGRVTENSPAQMKKRGISRVCKNAFLHRFKRTMEALGWMNLDASSFNTYQDCKLNAEEMVHMKKLFKMGLSEKGRWTDSDLKQSLYIFK